MPDMAAFAVSRRGDRRAIGIGRSRECAGWWELRGARPLPWKPLDGDDSKAAPGRRCRAADRDLPAPAARGLGLWPPGDGAFVTCGRPGMDRGRGISQKMDFI